MVKKKFNWIALVAVIALLVAVVAVVLVLKANYVAEPSLAPKIGPLPVKANSCNADGICETNSLFMGDKDKNVSISLVRKPFTPDRYEISVSRGGSGNYFFFNNTRINEEGIKITAENPSTGFFRFTEISQNEIKFGAFVGSGNAYVCVRSDGRLYRSQTPCA